MRRALVLGLLAFSSQAAPSRGFKTGTIRFDTPRGAWVVKVELALDDAQHARGLMFRREVRSGTGMLFVFASSEEHSFWMHNTLVSLDLIFLGDDRKVVGIVAGAAPKTDTLRTVGKPSRYVVEVAAGEAAAHAVGPGTRVAFIDVPE